MAKGKIFVQEYEANSKEIQKSYNDQFCGIHDSRNTNVTPKKKKRKK